MAQSECGRLKNDPPKISRPNPWYLQMLHYMAEAFVDVIKFRTLRGGDYPGLSRWVPNVTATSLYKGGRGRFDYRRVRQKAL